MSMNYGGSSDVPKNKGGKGGGGKGSPRDYNSPAPIPQGQRPTINQVRTGKTTTSSMKPSPRGGGTR